ncbi:MAG TPA: hypothetical protein VLI93_07150 [Acetobacteraceae bacterium]|nr:hypothetical protein [Acetobacteraceae bacterium]
MAAPPTYVNLKDFAVNEVFDAKYKSNLPGIMEKAAEKAVKASSKLTLDKPKDKAAKGYSLDGSLVSLGPDKSGKNLRGECSLIISTWPGKSVKAMPSGNAALPIDDPNKIDAGDVKAVAEGCVKSAMDSATDYMEKHAP